MKILKAIGNWFKKSWKNIVGFLLFIGGILVAFFLGRKTNDKKNNYDLPDADAITNAIVDDRISEFRDRSEQVVRGLFDSRGHTTDPSNSGTGDSENSRTGENGINSTIHSDNRSAEQGDTDMENNRNFRDSRDSVIAIRYSHNPIELDDPGFNNFIEGPMIRNKGSGLLAILAPLQFKYGQLTAGEVVAIYNQGRKDPSIIDPYCVLGRKAYLLTYDAVRYFNTNSYLDRGTPENYDIVIREWVSDTGLEYDVYDGDTLIYFTPEIRSSKRVPGQILFLKWS